MSESPRLKVGDRALVYLEPSRWSTHGWLPGTIVRIDGYSAHRNFYWIELDVPAKPSQGVEMGLVSVLNPKHIRRA
jgi:hypothetical protein